MSQRWISKFTLSLVAGGLLFTACKKNFSSDNALPTSYYPSVIINSDNAIVYGIDPSTGKKNWQFSMPRDTSSAYPFKPSPVVYNEMVYMATVCSDTIYKLNSKTGALVKKITVTGHSTVAPPMYFYTMVSTPILDGGILYIATTNDTLYALDTGTGNTKWKFGAPDGSPFYASPTIYNNNIYVATIGAGGPLVKNGHVYCLNKTSGPDANGNPIWDYPGLDTVSNASFISSPCITPIHVFIGSASDSNMYCMYTNPPALSPPVIPNNGKLHWTFKANGNILSSPTTEGGFCFFGAGDGCVYDVDSTRGLLTWKQTTSAKVNSSPIICNQVIYVGSYDYNLYSLAIATGKINWKFATKGLIKSSPIPYNGAVYVASYDNYIYSVDSTFGTMKWSYYVNGNIECSPVIDDLSGRNQINSGISGYNTSGSIN